MLPGPEYGGYKSGGGLVGSASGRVNEVQGSRLYGVKRNTVGKRGGSGRIRKKKEGQRGYSGGGLPKIQKGESTNANSPYMQSA